MLIRGVNQSVCLSRRSSCFHQQQQCVNELLPLNGANESCSSSSLNEMNTKYRKHSSTTDIVLNDQNRLRTDVAAATWELTAEHLRKKKKQPQDSNWSHVYWWLGFQARKQTDQSFTPQTLINNGTPGIGHLKLLITDQYATSVGGHL